MSTVLGKKDKAVKMVSWRDETMNIVKIIRKKVKKEKRFYILDYLETHYRLQVKGHITIFISI